jgi:hypothetical protein
MVIPMVDIKSVELNHKSQNDNADIKNELLKIGRAKQHNIKITFNQPINYWGMMGAFVESFEQVLINLEQPNIFINDLAQINSPQQQVA